MATTGERLRNYADALDPNESVLTEAADLIDELVKAAPDLSSVITWLENGCDPAKAAIELRLYQAKIDTALALARKG